ncbi:chromate transporter [Caldisalinibacter kiritimatiensis]|uniref:Chromate transport protein ChrA n=1 Tax=Caldisalinibacter kiritimatiensis TaxID=1304284 RepID=R1CHJ3_9FIRM|nr:chromate transporter [Caldisalinibacter kiritimatiensis]EOD01765.1 Chromate transport protein ChrA [Caldisalinibacter kiritimatiensis]
MLLKLFVSFLKIGLFSFGGGYAMLPLIRQEVIDIHGWITSSDFIDILAISQITPGPIAINSATFLGYKIAGVLGSIVATLAVIIPSTIIILTIAHFFNKYKDSKYVEWAFKGIRPVVLGLIASAAVLVAKDAFIDVKSVLIAGMIFYILVFRKTHPILAIVLAGVLGVAMY